MRTNEITAVLVHGAWADGSSWTQVIRKLHQEGIKTVTPSIPLTTYADDVAALDRALERVDGPTVVVGHAYAGAVIGGSRSDKVKGLVYVAALAPDQGETVAEVFGRDTPHPQAPTLAPDAHGLLWLPERAFAEAFAQHASAEEQAVLASLQRPLSPACISVPMNRPRWHDLPSWYLLAERDRMIPRETQAFMAERMGATRHSHPLDHTPSVTAPALVAALIRQAIDAVAH